MADPISLRLARISQKDPRQRTQADMAFLTWCSTGGTGPPPRDDENSPLANPAAGGGAAAGMAPKPAIAQGMMGGQASRPPPPKPTAERRPNRWVRAHCLFDIRALASLDPTSPRSDQHAEATNIFA